MREFFGSEAGLSPATVVRLTGQWQEDRSSFMERELSENDYVVYVWVDGIDTKVRLGHDDRLCRLPVMARRGRRARRSLWPFKTSTESPKGRG